MCIRAGLKNWEIDDLTVCDCIMHIRAFQIQEKENWKHTSMIAFNVARFGNSDPQTFPKSIKQYMPELWNDEVEEEEDELIQAARQWRLQKYINAGRA